MSGTLRSLAEKQIRRGVDEVGRIIEQIPRCGAISPGGVLVCNLAQSHRLYDRHDQHEYFNPISGGRTVHSWPGSKTTWPAITTGEPGCCHYSQTGRFCEEHQPKAHAAARMAEPA